MSDPRLHPNPTRPGRAATRKLEARKKEVQTRHPRTTAAAVALVGIGALLAAAPALACCAHGFRVCGPASGSGTIEVAFDVNNACTATAVASVSDTETAFDVCSELQAGLDGDCPSPGQFPGDPQRTCELICYPDPNDPDCAVLLDEKNCAVCDVEPNPTTCCGITITEYLQPMQ